MNRPLAFLDIETTGTNPATDRIVELAIGLVPFEQAVCQELPQPVPLWAIHEWRVNPGVPIPPEASEVHGIKDEDVAGLAPFSKHAREILKLLKGVDLAGFELARFDIPLLEAEFRRVGIEWDHQGAVIDCASIFKKQHPRTLIAALALYCNRPHTEAHGAMGDVAATIDVLRAQVKLAMPELPNVTAESLARYSQLGDMPYIDIAGKLVRDKDGDAVFTFGKERGRKVRNATGFARWMLDKDFSANTLRCLREELIRIEKAAGEDSEERPAF
jgi:DNA polymerase-3 subunit epsilon